MMFLLSLLIIGGLITQLLTIIVFYFALRNIRTDIGSHGHLTEIPDPVELAQLGWLEPRPYPATIYGNLPSPEE